MKFWTALPRRTQGLVLILVAVVGVYVYSLVAVRFGARELLQAAQKEIGGIHNDENDVACEVTVSKAFVLFGEERGKVEVFVRPKYEAGEAPIHAVSFYYVRAGGGWKLDGSGASASDESHRRGLSVFARRNPGALKSPS